MELMQNQVFATPQEALAHYGVKGMKWGVRKEDEVGGTHPLGPKAAASGRSQAADIPEEERGATFGFTRQQAMIGAGILLGVGLGAAVYYDVGGVRSKTLERGFRESTLRSGERQLDQIYGHDRKNPHTALLPEGQSISRMSRVDEKEIRMGAYAAYRNGDMSYYKAFWSQKGYQVNIKALQDIKMPDLNERLRTMTELIDKDPSIRKELVSRQSTTRSKLWVKTAPSADLAKYTYAKFDVPDWKRGIGQKYLKALGEKGYGAVLDHVDAGSLTKDPIIVVNEKLFEISSTTKMTQAELDSAYYTFKNALSS